MELTTRCPQCETAFAVALEQLQLRKGYIRCINCANIFDGFEAVVPAEPPGPQREHAPKSGPSSIPPPTRAPVEPNPSARPFSIGTARRAPENGERPVGAARPAPDVEPSIGSDRSVPAAAGEPSIGALRTAHGSEPSIGTVRGTSINEPSIGPMRGTSSSSEPSIGTERGTSVNEPSIGTERRTSVNEPSIGPMRGTSSSSEPSFRAGSASVRTTDTAIQREPQMPSVLRGRDAMPRAGSAAAGPSFTIPDTPSPISTDARTRAPGPRAGVLHERPQSGPQIGPTRDQPIPTVLVEPDESADYSDSNDDGLYMEPRAGHRSRAREELFDGPRRQSGWLSLVWAVFSILGLLILLLQGAYVYRAQLANSFPTLRPMLESACLRIGCDVPYERRIDAIAITGSALRSSAAPQDGVSSLTLEVTLRNTHTRPQEWPTLVLDLKDASGAVVVRRNLPPETWVPAEQRPGPFEAGRELTVQLPVSVKGLQANGYQLDKFFP